MAVRCAAAFTPDGRMLHWQGMIWDHASELDEEDVRALIAYLRTCRRPARIRRRVRRLRTIASSIPSGSRSV